MTAAAIDAGLGGLWLAIGIVCHAAGGAAALVAAGWLVKRRERFGPAAGFVSRHLTLDERLNSISTVLTSSWNDIVAMATQSNIESTSFASLSWRLVTIWVNPTMNWHCGQSSSWLGS